MNTSLFSKTPTVTVLDYRGLTVRDIVYHRHPDSPDVTSEHITRHHHNARGFLTQSADPRLSDAGLANFTWLTDLTGNVLRTQGVDNGTSVSLNDAAGRPFIAVSNIRTADDGTEGTSQSVTRTWQYEDAKLPGRPVSITEQLTDEDARITERFVYAGNTDAEKALNLAGAWISHYDIAGLVQTDSIALTGIPLSVTRRLLKDADNPDVVADWQGGDATVWNDLLGSEAYTTLTTADATSAVLTTTDARGNRQQVAYDVAGLLTGSWLTLKDSAEQVIVKSLTYSATGQKLREVHGNGVVTTYTYEAETQRLTGITTERPAGHASGAKVLQDLRYEYDPVGNVLNVTNDAEETRFWRNQKVVPENTYVYDSLYQLVSATGREMASAGQQSSGLPSATVPLPTDSSAYTNYTRVYTYDNAGNLTQIRHSAPATNNSYTTNITVSERSNRGVLSTLTENPSEVDMLFTAGGQQRQLQPGQSLIWTPRNELLKVTPVVRDGSTDDRESYRYDGSSQRILKVSLQKTGGSMQTQRVLYLPGLELRSTQSGETETERLQVMSVDVAGRAQMRVLYWETGQPADIQNNQIRYSYDSLAGSSQLELDGDGNIISMEEYYPYGGTAVWAVRSAVEAEYKTIRYSGKEQDATGLYYYGYRYYQPWAGRWLSADPAGTVDGLNLFQMCTNNPVKYTDSDGRMLKAFSDCLRAAADSDRQIAPPESYLQRRRGNVGITTFIQNDDEQGAPPEVSAIRGRRLAVGIASPLPGSGNLNTAVSMPKRPGYLKMVKEEALEDKLQIKNKKFVNLQNKREQYKVNILDGKLFYRDELLTTKESGRFKFIQDENDSIYGVETSDDPEGIKHSSLLGESWPISAGTLSVHEGDVIQLTSSSGHFRPANENMEYTKSYLEIKGVSVMSASPFFGEGKKTQRVKKDVQSYKRKYMNILE